MISPFFREIEPPPYSIAAIAVGYRLYHYPCENNVCNNDGNGDNSVLQHAIANVASETKYSF